ncbi:GHMP kinase [Candidatus Micrarchaeota archaeon]|nr:GHMP kinase [Candidatus Micrarchaeota archaeon]
MYESSRAPLRLSFAGGGSDVSPYCEEHGGIVLNATISKFTWVSLKKIPGESVSIYHSDGTFEQFKTLDDFISKGISPIKHVCSHFKDHHNLTGGLEIHLRNDAPGMSGLGGSASFFVSAINSLRLLTLSDINKYDMAELAFNLERQKLGNIGGRQDQYAAAFGGINFIEFKGNDFVRMNPLTIKQDVLLELEKRLVLVNLGKRRKSGDIISDQVKRVTEHNSKSLKALDETKKIAISMKHSLNKGDLDDFSKLLSTAWEAKKNFSPLISNTYIDGIYEYSLKNGAAAGKITGAGGGGHMMLLAKPNEEEALKRALIKKGLLPIPFTFQMHGVESWRG